MLIGQGAYSEVYKEGDYATKRVNYEKNIISVSSIREISFLNYLNSKHITKLSKVNDKQIFMEYSGDSIKAILKERTFKINEITKYLVQLLHALDYIHKHHVIHCDIKPDNILLLNDTVKLCDFNISSFNNNKNKGDVYTIWYRPLESIYGVYTDKSDIWALGCTIYEMYTGNPLFNCKERTNKSIIKKVTSVLGTPSKEIIVKYKLDINYSSSRSSSLLTDDPFLNTVLEIMLIYDVDKRPSAEDMLKLLGYKSLYNYDIQIPKKYSIINKLKYDNVISEQLYYTSSNLLDYLIEYKDFSDDPLYQWVIVCMCSMLFDNELLNFTDNILDLDIPDIDFGVAVQDILHLCNYNIIR
jgi:serine/threonine protein kinase